MNSYILFFKQFLVLAKSKLLLLFLSLILFCGFGLLYYFIQNPKYTGKSSFVLQEKTNSLSSFAGIASQLGIDVPGANSSGSLFAGENILEILKSKKIINTTLLSSINSEGDNRTLIDLYLECSKLKKEWNKSSNKEIASIYFPIGLKETELSRVQDSVLQIVHSRLIKNELIIERTDKKTTVIEVSVYSKDVNFSKFFTQRLIEFATSFYVDVKTGTMRKNVIKLEKRADSILYMLNGKTYQTSDSKIVDVNPALNKAIIPNEMANRDKTILLTLYAEVIKNLEILRISVAQETPVIQVLDSPGQTIFDNKLTLLKSLLISFILGIIFYFFILILITISKSIKYNFDTIDL